MILLEFSLTNLRFFLAGNTPTYPENDPVFHIYTSQDLGVMKESEKSTATILEQGLIINQSDVSRTHTLYLPEADKLRASSSFVIGLYAHSEDQGVPYLVSCGTASLNVNKQIRLQKTPVTHKLELIDPHPKSPVTKATLDITFKGVKWDIDPVVETKPWMCIPGEREEWWMADMEAYVLRVMSMFLSEEDDAYYGIGKPNYRRARKYKPTHPKLKQIHCPFYQMDILGKKLPGFAYSWIRPRTTPNERYFVKLIKCALQLYEMNEEDFISAVQNQNNSNNQEPSKLYKMAVDVVGGACSLYAQGQLYVPDHVNTYHPGSGKYDPSKFIQDVENMNNLRVTHGNDCEDMGQDNAITALTLKLYDGWTNPLTKSCQQILKQFLVLLPHGAVATASAAESINNSNAPEEADFIAHIFCILIPYGRVKTMTERTGCEPVLLGVPENLTPWNANLDIVFCEGTGRVSPILRPEWEWRDHDRDWYIQTARSQVEFEKTNTSFASFNILQTPLIAHPKNTYNFNTFYRYMVGSFVPSGQGAVVGDITFVYPNEGTYGVLIHDVVYDMNNPGIAINETLTLDQVSFIKDCLLSAHPVPQLVPRNQSLIDSDIRFLEGTIGLRTWTPEQRSKHFGYFFTMDELRKDPTKLKFGGAFEATYKYIGLDDVTAYIELCVYQK